ncbi:hypothetical protein [Cyclobacterium amurskyense]|uniref:Uncharacterized protein n=1 Tax=Cyclobacterium amurskyense TaxID=320787 RepID=A0A0H4PIR1_9BACT|nr:hypothetical protein [Cyclobacterium amurskyense]AKP52940.1 hypothetical protein CA2015_3560 [Cyclobacterium amurskyense]
MKKKITLQKATVAAGVVAMSVGLFNSFNVEADGGSGYMCCPGTSYCTDESGIVWSEDRPVDRDFPGDTCTNHQ